MTRAGARRIDRADGRVICDRCVFAENVWTRLKGLLGRSRFEAGEGLLLRPSSSIHTWFMRFPIDVVFVSRELVVLRVVAGLRPWRAAMRRKAHAVLELPAGTAAREGLAVGDRLVVTGAAGS